MTDTIDPAVVPQVVLQARLHLEGKAPCPDSLVLCRALLKVDRDLNDAANAQLDELDRVWLAHGEGSDAYRVGLAVMSAGFEPPEDRAPLRREVDRLREILGSAPGWGDRAVDEAKAAVRAEKLEAVRKAALELHDRWKDDGSPQSILWPYMRDLFTALDEVADG